jgi:hypothetical protein
MTTERGRSSRSIAARVEGGEVRASVASSILITDSSTRVLASPSTPYLASCLDDQLQFCPLIGLGKVVALHGGGEAALWAQCQLL